MESEERRPATQGSSDSGGETVYSHDWIFDNTIEPYSITDNRRGLEDDDFDELGEPGYHDEDLDRELKRDTWLVLIAAIIIFGYITVGLVLDGQGVIVFDFFTLVGWFFFSMFTVVLLGLERDYLQIMVGFLAFMFAMLAGIGPFWMLVFGICSAITYLVMVIIMVKRQQHLALCTSAVAVVCFLFTAVLH